MGQEQKPVPLVLKRGEANQSVVTGNNAAWLCPCGRDLPLTGPTSISGSIIEPPHLVYG